MPRGGQVLSHPHHHSPNWKTCEEVRKVREEYWTTDVLIKELAARYDYHKAWMGYLLKGITFAQCGGMTERPPKSKPIRRSSQGKMSEFAVAFYRKAHKEWRIPIARLAQVAKVHPVAMHYAVKGIKYKWVKLYPPVTEKIQVKRKKANRYGRSRNRHLSDNEVRRARWLYQNTTMTQQNLADMFGITVGSSNKLLNRKTYRWVD